MPDAAESLKAALAARYQIDSVIGVGGMATVYLAVDLARSRQVAIKVLRPELTALLGKERFLREISVTARLDHPHIVPLFDSGEAGGFLYYAMPYVEGESIADRLKRDKVLPVAEAVRLAREVAGALQYANDRGIVHRDIKPQNILLAAGHARVADFGIALATSGDKLTATGMSIGTPDYMSPEQSAGGEVDARSDVYSLASVLYEMLAGEPPYTGPTMQAVIAKRWKDPVPKVSTVRETVSPALEAVIVKGLAKEPIDRYASAGEFANALEGATGPTAAAVPGPRLAAWLRPVAFGGLAVVAAFFVWAVLFRGRHLAASALDRIAVLPLESRLPDSTKDYLVTGMHDALMAELSQFGAVLVIARGSVMQYASSAKSDQAIGKELRADALVKMKLAPVGDSISVTVDVVDPMSQTQKTWVYATTAGRALSLARDIAQEIGRFRGKQAADLGAPLTPRRPTDSVAVVALAKARFYATRSGPNDLELADRYLEDAIRADSSYASAYALTSEQLINKMFRGLLPPHVAFDRAKTAARRAIQLDERLADAHYQLGYVLALYDWDWQAAEAEFKRAIQLNPSSSEALGIYGFFLSWMGRPVEALGYAERAAVVDPVSVVAVTNVASVLLLARRYDAAIAKANEAVLLSPSFPLAYERLGMAYEAKKSYPQALEAYRKALSLFPNDPFRLASVARLFAQVGRADTARVILADLLAKQRSAYVPPLAIASVYASLNEPDHAIDWVERGYESRSAETVALQVASFWDPLRTNPRFIELIHRMKFPR